MGIADIQAAINSIPSKKEDLRKAFEELESYSSSFASFTLQWRDIDGHFSSIEKSIDKRFQELKAKLAPEKPTAPVSAANAKVGQDRPVIEPPPELKYHCVKMDAMGLKSYIIGHRKGSQAVRKELGPALLCSPDPVTLVLDSFEGFVSSSGKMESENQAIRRAYLIILECFHGLKLEVKHSDKERARRVAKDCYNLIKNRKINHNRQIINNKEKTEKNHHGIVLMVFLHLIVTFGLLEYFAIGDILDVLVTVASKKNIVDLCRHSALEEKLPDLIDKLNKKGRQLDSIKFVLAFNLQHKFPPASLFEAYIKEAGKGLQRRALEGKNSTQLKYKAISEQIIAVRAVIRAVKEYNLGDLYPPGSLQNRIQQLKKQRLENKPVSVLPEDQKQQQHKHQQPNKRPRPSDSSATVLRPHPHSQIQPQPGPVNSAPTVLPRHPHSENRPQLGLVDQSPYMGLGGSYGSTAAPPVYGLGNPIGLGGSLAPPESSYLYPPAGPAYDNRPLPYGGYPSSGFPPYNQPPYP
ncbi:hypothetical protein IEQ34_002565 [Dendrobium chrysotoxum]|uniref:FRIGIDA-like protein n=1 Tax=Dendrobium chrysotoxum TaxID=161865 RepID=A0AAV7HF68_DENCH|nr:hypothetical protein IEQ34_002565 [Dendrobium chrysotoxum]